MIENFFQKVLELKNVPRQGWKEKLGVNNPESVADHSYSTAVMSMILSDLQGLNSEKIIKMALLHDLAESIIGDITPDHITKNEKNSKENLVMKQILKNLPSKITNSCKINRLVLYIWFLLTHCNLNIHCSLDPF